MTKQKRVKILLAIGIGVLALAATVPFIFGIWHFHSFVSHAATESTCSEAGNDVYHTCKKCDAIFDKNKKEISKIPERELLPHTFGEYVPNGDETCVHEGTKTATCEKCGAIGTLSVPMLDHTFSALVPAVKETCTKDGMQAHYTCATCNNYFDKDKNFKTKEELVIPATHKGDGKWKNDSVSHWQTCKVCGGKANETKHLYDNVKDASCNECKSTRSLDRVLVTSFDSMDKVGAWQWDKYQTFDAEIVTLGDKHPSKPAYALDAGNTALKLRVHDSQWWIAPALEAADALSVINKLDDDDYITIWMYRTDDQWDTNWYLLGTMGKNNIFNTEKRAGQIYETKTDFEKNGGKKQWYGLNFSIGELKESLKNQEGLRAKWLQFTLNFAENSDIYIYSIEYTKSKNGVETSFDSLDKTATSVWDEDMNRVLSEAKIVDLSAEGLQKPAGAMDAGNKALKITSSDEWGYERSIYFSEKLNVLDSYHDSDYFLVWMYRTVEQWDSNWWMLGNIDRYFEGTYGWTTTKANIFNSWQEWQWFEDTKPMLRQGTTGEWYSMKFTVGELKAQLKKQGTKSASWMDFYLNLEKDSTVYFYSVEFHEEFERNIQVASSASKKVKVASKGMPLTNVEIKISGLKFGEAVYIINKETGEEITFMMKSGTFKMPCAGVRIEVRNLLDTLNMDDLVLSMGTGNVALPDELDPYYDSCSVKVKKEGKTVDKSKYIFDSTTYDITFKEDGKYQLEYTVKRGSEKKTLKRNVIAYVYVSSVMDSIDDYAACEWKNVGNSHTAEIVTLDKVGLTKPESATDVGNKALKVTMNEGMWEAEFAIYAGNALKTLSSRNDSDYFMIWMYHEGEQWNNNYYTLGNLQGKQLFEHLDGQTYDDRSANFSPSAQGSWHMLKLTVGELKAQAAKQGVDACEWIELHLNFAEKSSFYIYSVEYHQEQPRNIEVAEDAASKIQVKSSEIAMKDVKVTVSNLENGEAVYVFNKENQEVIAVLYETGKFTMPFADVRIEVRNIYAQELETLTLLMGTGDISLPDILKPYYNSFTIVVKQNGEAVDNKIYSFNSKTNVITFKQDGAYTIEYTLKQGKQEAIMNRDVVVYHNVSTVFDSLDNVGMGIWDYTYGTAPYTTAIVDLAQEGIAVPAQATNVGNKALKITMDSGQWGGEFGLRLGNIMKNLDSYADNDEMVIWTYRTGDMWNSNWFLLGNISENNVFDWNQAGQLFDSRTVFAGSGETGKWYATSFNIAEIKAQMAKQGATSANWMEMFLNYAENSSVYLYSIELREAIVPGEDVEVVKGVESKLGVEGNSVGTTWGESYCSKSYVTFEEAGISRPSQALDAGDKLLKLTTSDWEARTAIYFSAKLKDLSQYDNDDYFILWTYFEGEHWNNEGASFGLLGNLNPDKLFNAEQEGQLYANKTPFALSLEQAQWIPFKLTVGDLKIMLQKQGLSSAEWMLINLNFQQNTSVYLYSVEFHEAPEEPSEPVETVTVESALGLSQNIANDIWGADYYTKSIVTFADAGISKPAQALDAGDTLLKFTTTAWQAKTGMYFSDKLKDLSQYNDDDYFILWMYFEGEHWDTDWASWCLLGTIDEWNNIDDRAQGQESANKTQLSPSTVQKEWIPMKFTVAELKAMLSKQGNTSNTVTGMLISLNFTNGTNAYLYSVEFHEQ